MKNLDKVIAVTVTFNDADFMLRCVNALLNQTYPVDKIVVVDNNSNSDNKNILKNITDERVLFVSLDDNLGGAGGFEAGMRYTKENLNADWYWLMDADAYPKEDCLELLLQHKNDRNNIGFLAPLIYGTDLKEYQLYHHKRLAHFLERDIPVYSDVDSIPEVSEIEADAFVGPLFSKKAVDKLGIADGSLFIYGDDLEYTYRVTRQFSGLLIKKAIMYHRDQPASNGVQQPKNWWKDYYMYRNRLLFIAKYKSDSVQGCIGVFLTRLRCIKQILLASKISNPRLRNFRVNLIRLAFKDGSTDKSGKTIDPNRFMVKILKLEKQG